MPTNQKTMPVNAIYYAKKDHISKKQWNTGGLSMRMNKLISINKLLLQIQRVMNGKLTGESPQFVKHICYYAGIVTHFSKYS